MASNIKVVLEVDNKKYLADIRAADRATKDFATTANNIGGSGFAKLTANIDAVHKRLMSLKTLVAGAMFAGLGRSALQMADELQDLSNATGIAIGRLIEFKKALAVSGGEGDQMATAINAFVRSIDEAAQGGLKAQNSFKELGISLKDLGKLSEQDLLEQTLKGIAAIEDPSRRAALMMDKFGKSFKTVDPGELLAKLQATRGEGDKYADSIKRAAQLQDDFATAQGNLKLAFLEAFAPAIKMVNDFSEKVNQGKASMDGLVTAIKLAGVALTAAFSASLLLPVVSAFGSLARSIGVVAKAVGAVGLGAWLGSAFRVLGPLMSGLRALSLLIAAGMGIYAATQLFDNFGDIASNSVGRVTEAVGQLAGELLNLPTDAIAGLMNLFGANIKDAVGLGTPFKIAAENAKKAREEYEKTFKANKARSQFAATDPRRTDVAGTSGEAGTAREVTDALAQKRKEIERSSEAYSRYIRDTIDAINFENTLIGKTEEEVAVRKAVEEVYKRAADEAEKLRDAKAMLTKDEQGLAAAYDAQIAKIAAAADADAERIRRAVENSNGLKLLEKSRLADIENMTKALEAQLRIQEALGSAQRNIIGQKQDVAFQGSMLGKTPFEKQMAEIKENARKAALEAGAAFAATFEDSGDGMNPDQAKQFAQGLNLIHDGYKDIADAQIANLEASRTWSAGWQEAFAAYKDSAQNAAEQSRTYFETFTRGVEDAFVSFVTTGKLSFKDLANSLIADFARIQAKKAIAGIFSMASGGGGFLGGLSTLFGGGRAEGGPVGVGGAYMVGERGPEMFVPKNAGTIIPNGALGGGSTVQQITYNIQATDAASFKAQLARDPSFVHAVVEQGRRSTPGGARR